MPEHNITELPLFRCAERVILPEPFPSLPRDEAAKPKEPKPDSQDGIVLAYLRRNGSITQGECTAIYGGTRLSQRIAELRAMGHNISPGEHFDYTNALGKHSRPGRYTLKKGQ